VEKKVLIYFCALETRDVLYKRGGKTIKEPETTHINFSLLLARINVFHIFAA
jgi:hypothetical protein